LFSISRAALSLSPSRTVKEKEEKKEKEKKERIVSSIFLVISFGIALSESVRYNSFIFSLCQF
jgi:hypothetical protein